MSTLTLNSTAVSASSGSLIAALRTRIMRYRLYRQTLVELSKLDNHMLEDLGLNRSMLKRVAYQSAYEAS